MDPNESLSLLNDDIEFGIENSDTELIGESSDMYAYSLIYWLDLNGFKPDTELMLKFVELFKEITGVDSDTLTALKYLYEEFVRLTGP